VAEAAGFPFKSPTKVPNGTKARANLLFNNQACRRRNKNAFWANRRLHHYRSLNSCASANACNLRHTLEYALGIRESWSR
jgi:hypothetical protein